MSLQNIGKILSVLDNGTEAINVLKDIGDLSSAGKALKSINLPDTEKIKLLKEAFEGTSESAAKAALGIKNATTTVSAADAIWLGLKSTLVGVGQTLLNVLQNPLTWIVATLAITGIAINKVANASSKANETMRNSADAYGEAQSNLESVNSELENTQAKMEALLAKDSLTFVEQGELENLKEATKELQLQQSIREAEEKEAARELADDSFEAYEKNFGKYDISEEATQAARDILNGPGDPVLVSEMNDLSSALALWEDNKKKYEAALESGDVSQYEILKKIYEDSESSLWSGLSLLQEYQTNMRAVYDELTEPEKQILETIGDQIDHVWSTLDPSGWKQGALTDLFNTPSMTKYKNQLIEMAEATDGLGISVEDIKKKFPGLKNILATEGFSLNDLTTFINSQVDTIDFGEIRYNLLKAFEPDDEFVGPIYNGFNDWINTLSNEDLQIVYDLYLNTDTASWQLEDWQRELEEAKLNAPASPSPTFADALTKVIGPESEDTLSEYIDDFQSNISDIQTALENLKSGEFTKTDLTDLIQQFPELASQTENLETSLSSLQTDKLKEVISTIRTEMNDLTDPEEMESRESLIESLMASIDLSKSDMDSLHNEILKSIWTGTSGNPDAIISNKDAFFSEFADELSTEKGTQIIYSLLLDPANANLTMDEFIQKYEDLEFEVDLRISNETITNLQKDLEDLQSDATELQNKHSIKEALGKSLTSDDYRNLIDNSKDQVANNQAQITEYTLMQLRLDPSDADYEAKYAELQSCIDSCNESVTEATISQIEYNQAIQNLPITKLQNELSSLETEATKLQDSLSTKELLGEEVTAGDYQALIDNSKEQIVKFEEQNAELRKQLAESGLTEADQGYWEIQSQIDANDASIRSIIQSQIEWNQAIENLPITRLQNAFSDLEVEATAIQDAISLNEAKGIKSTLSDYKALIKNSRQQVKNLQSQNAELRKQQVGLDSNSTRYREIQAEIDANVQAINAARISQLEWNETVEQLDYQPNEGLTAYNKAKETRNAGDNYLDMLAAAKEAQEARKKGLIGTDDFKTVAKMFSPNGMDDYTNWDENYDNITRYFTEDEKGVLNFLEDLEDKNLAAQDSMGNWSYNIDDIQKSADALGISFEAFLAVMGRLQDYGFTNDYFSTVEEGQDHIGDLYADLTEAEMKMRELQQKRNDGDATVTDAVLAAQEARVNQIKQSILESQDLLEQLSQKSAQEWQAEQDSKIQSILTMAKTSTQLDEGYVQGYLNNLRDIITEAGLEVDLADLFIINDDGSLAINWGEYARLEEEYGKALEISTDFQDSFAQGITSAYDEADSEIKPLIDSLKQYTNEELSSITFGDGAYGEGELEAAERTIDKLLPILGLEQTEAQLLLETLGQLGLIDYKVDVDTEEAETEISELGEGEEVTVPVTVETPTDWEVPIDDIGIDGNPEKFNTTVEETVENANQQESTVTINTDDRPARITLQKLVSDIRNNHPEIQIEVDDSKVRNEIQEALKDPFAINVNANVSSSGGSASDTGEAPKAYGTLAPARASGTAYNMLNLHPAFANGTDVALKSDENALVNEIGSEGLIRNGKLYWIPGGMHVQALKKGDIVLSAKQMSQLMSSGKASGHGKVYGSAYANGTAQSLMPTHALNRGGINILNDNSGTKSSSDSLNNSLNDLSNSTDETTSALDNLLEKLDNLIDWIEYRRNYLSGEIDYKLAQSENATGYTKKNKQVSSAQNITSSLIEVDKKALKKYEQHAESIRKQIGLSEILAKKVREGTIEIETLSEDDKKRVEKYQEWYDKIKVCRDEIEELNTSLKELAQQKIDNITEQFDAVLEKIDHRKNTIDSFVENAELKGYVDSTKYYSKLIANENKTIAQLTKERDAMQKSFDESVAKGYIKKGSLEYKQMQNEINGVTEEINEATNAALELANTARQIKWDRFDSTTEGINTIVDEADFLLGLLDSEDMYDEKGNVTAEGKASYGLNAVKYQTALDQVARAQKEQEEIEKNWLNEDGTYDTAALERWQELEKVIQDNASAADDAKESMKELVKEGIEAQLSALKELIDEYTEALKSQKELYDYQQDISEKTEEISKLQKRLAVYFGDDSEEGRLKRQQTEEELKKAQKELEETEYDKYISDQEELLNNLYDEFEEALNKRLDDFNITFEAIKTGISDNADIIKTTLENQAKDVGTTLTTTMSNIWGDAGSNGILSSVNSGVQSIVGFMEILTKQADQNAVGNTGTDKEKQSAIKSLMSQGTKHEGALTEKEKKNHSDLWEYFVEEYGYTPYSGVTKDLANILGVELSNAESPTSKDKANVLTALKKLNGDDKKTSTQSTTAKDTAIKTLAEKYKVAPSDAIIRELAKLLEIEVSSKLTDDEKLKVLDTLKIKGYAKGTNSVKKDEWANLMEEGQEIITLPDGSIIMPLAKGSGVINNPKTEQVLSLADNADSILQMVDSGAGSLLDNQIQQIMDAGSQIHTSHISNNSGLTSVTNQISIELPNVQNYNDFVTQMQHDSNFEKMIQAMTIGQVNGQSKLNKYRYKW